jgi:hypothetical protein
MDRRLIPGARDRAGEPLGETVEDECYRRLPDSFLAAPSRARDLLATRPHEACSALAAPFWMRIRALLDRDIEQRSRTLARYGLPGGAS